MSGCPYESRRAHAMHAASSACPITHKGPKSCSATGMPGVDKGKGVPAQGGGATIGWLCWDLFGVIHWLVTSAQYIGRRWKIIAVILQHSPVNVLNHDDTCLAQTARFNCSAYR